MSGAALMLAASASFAWFSYQGEDPVDREVVVEEGEFRNPVLQGFYPDPSVTRVGEDFYLVHSTFSWFPGLPVWHSRDLVNWRQIGNAIDRTDQLDFAKLGMSRAVFAPSIEHHAGTFYILNTCVDCGGNFVITATDPAGPWSDPTWLPELEGGIDPSLFVDAEGQAWVINNGPPVGTPRYDGHRAIWIQRIDLATLKTFGERKVLVDGGIVPEDEPVWIEGPNIYHVDGRYYLSCAEGGTSVNHSQVILRSRAPDGPYTPGPEPIILTQRDLPADRPNPVTSAGHADLVTTPDGKWWATFLATRPYEGDLYNTGRETFVLPVTWNDGWPQILPPDTPIPLALPRPMAAGGEPVASTSGAFSYREEFDGPALSPEWIGMRIPQTQWWDFTSTPGTLTLAARPDGLGDFANPSFFGRRQAHANATAATSVTLDGDGQAGLAAMQNDEYWMAIAVTRQGVTQKVQLLRRTGTDTPVDGEMVAEAALPADGAVELSAEAAGATYRFKWRDAAGWHQLGPDQDGTLLSTAKAGGFTGVVFGVFAQEAP